IRVNVDLAVDEGPDDGADTLDRVVSYETVAQTVRRLVGAGHVKLVETLAERIAAACLADTRVRLARVRVEKLDVFPDAGSAGVTVERARL
ncbi:MAG: dihydroneopterin aldolase, partial [Janthinobacterium lividum]